MSELARRNEPDIICQFLTFDEAGEDSVEDLEEANELIAPLMNYVKECKGTSTL